MRLLCALAMFASMVFPQISFLPIADETGLQTLARKVYDNINAERRARGLHTLHWNEELAGEARRHAVNMARRKFFDHVDPQRGDLAERINGSGIQWYRCSENLYREKEIRDPAEHVIQAWLNSPEHQKNMLDFWMAETGVGVAIQPGGVVFIVQEYMYPRFPDLGFYGKTPHTPE